MFEVSNLAVSFGAAGQRVQVVKDVSFSVSRGETLGIVGESGCGKSVTVMSSVRLVPSPPSHIDGGSVRLGDTDIRALSNAALRKLWGARVGIVFQDPMTSLNPTFTVGYQLREALRLHSALSPREQEARVHWILEKVGINSPASRMSQYPHELSGGLRQRILIAMALVCGPELLIADEPTTALDVTLQAQILDLLRSLRDEFSMAVVLITHDLGVVAEFCDRVAVMYAGRVVESASVKAIFARPLHPYTHGLLSSIPRLGTAKGTALPAIEGMVPPPSQHSAGCAFAPRCPRASEACVASQPPMTGQQDHQVACFHPMGAPLHEPA